MIIIIIVIIIIMIYYYYYFVTIFYYIHDHENPCCIKKKKQRLSAKSLLQVKRTCKDELATVHHGSKVTRVRFLLEQNVVAPITIMVSCCENLLEDGALIDAQLSTLV